MEPASNRERRRRGSPATPDPAGSRPRLRSHARHRVAPDVLLGPDRGGARRRRRLASRRQRAGARRRGRRARPAIPPTYRPVRPGDVARGESGVGSARRLDRRSPMADLPMGAEFGTAVHAVLETSTRRRRPGAALLSAAPKRWPAAVRSRRVERRPSHGATGGPLTAQRLAEALEPTLLHPTRTVADDLQPGRDRRPGPAGRARLRVPLAGGDRPMADVRIRRHRRPAGGTLAPDDPLADYPAIGSAIRCWPSRHCAAILTGSIDAVLRVGAESEPSYLIVDYKTNWLGAFDGPALTLASTTPRPAGRGDDGRALPAAGAALQRWRCIGSCAGDSPATTRTAHLGGVALPLRPRHGRADDTPRIGGVPCGVFSWRAAGRPGPGAVRPARSGAHPGVPR